MVEVTFNLLQVPVFASKYQVPECLVVLLRIILDVLESLSILVVLGNVVDEGKFICLQLPNSSSK